MGEIEEGGSLHIGCTVNGAWSENLGAEKKSDALSTVKGQNGSRIWQRAA